MNFSCTKDKLLQGLQLIEHITGRNSSLPVLQNVLIRAANHSLYIIGTDLEMGMQASVSAKTNKEGEVSVPLKTLLGFIRTLPEGLLECKEQNKHLSIRAGEFHAQIKGEDPSQYPLLPKRAQEEPFSLSAKEFAQTISYAVPSIANTDSKPELTGVYIHVSEDGMVAAATDSFRLAERRTPLSIQTKQSFILPGRAAQEIVRIFQQDESGTPLVCYMGANQVFFEYSPNERSHIPALFVVSRLIEGQYPQYEAIIPKTWQTNVVADRETLLRHARAAGMFSNKLREVKVTISPGMQKMTLATNDSASGEYRSDLPCAGQGEDQEILLNHQYLLEGIQGIGDADIRIKCAEAGKPVLLEPANEKGYLYIVMPLRGN